MNEPIKKTNHILFVDDEEGIVCLSQQVLERLGFQVTTRTASQEALELFKSGPGSFDLVITDMNMPNLTGVDLAHQLKEIRPDLPIILCTGSDENITEERARNIGIDGFLIKPVFKSQMEQVIQQVLGSS